MSCLIAMNLFLNINEHMLIIGGRTPYDKRFGQRGLDMHAEQDNGALPDDEAGLVADVAPTVVLIHGFLDSGATWRPLIEQLAAHGVKCVAPDLRGAGLRARSGGPYTLSQAVEDLLDALAQTDGRLAIIGHSMGAQIAELTATRMPENVDRLVLVTPTPLEGNVLPDGVRGMLRESGGNAAAQREIRMQFSVRKSSQLLDVDPDGLMGVEAVRGYYDAFTAGDGAGVRPCAYTGPVLMVGAEQDPVIPPTLVQTIRQMRFPNARLEFIDESGHWPQVEQAEALGRILAGFLRTGEA
jgi:pimeloyl-ACP methyl ester carboxylesterase